MTAWLVTRDEHGAKGNLEPRERVVAVLNRRWGSRDVARILQVLHNTEIYTLSEQAGFANDRAFDPYPVEYATIDGAPFGGHMMCGHNPYLLARMVDNLVIVGTPGNETVSWSERALPPSRRPSDGKGD